MISVQIDGAEKQMFDKLCRTNQLNYRNMFEFLVMDAYNRSNKGSKKVV